VTDINLDIFKEV